VGVENAGFALSSASLQAGYRLAGFDSVSSTNSLALEKARRGEPGGLWVVARAQTQGRGRRGRIWQSQPGNIAASLFVALPAGRQDAALLGFVAGVALMRTLKQLAPKYADAFALKWPNDLLMDGAKLAGILLEAEKLSSGDLAVVVGMGVNLQSAPADLPYPATSLGEAGAPNLPEVFFQYLSGHWVQCFEIWKSNSTLLLDEWRQSAAGIGCPIRIERAGDTVTGIFKTIDDDGRLRLQTREGRELLITAGDVYF
jgi:BirA family transcriptional regulator, biotin operon repressor / biotin---[acetyl-CoA-carboxylase] ligase